MSDRQEYRQAAREVLTMPPDDALQVITGLIELANDGGGHYGFHVVLDGSSAKLESRKYSGDYYCEGLPEVALKAIAHSIGGR